MFTLIIEVFKFYALKNGENMGRSVYLKSIASVFLCLLLTVSVVSRADDMNDGMDLSQIVGDAWTITKKERGVTHYTQPVKGFDLNAYKGVCTINKPLGEVYTLLTDVASHPSWVAYCDSSTLVKRNSDDEAIQYYNFDIPWPFLNRDIVVHSRQKTNHQTGIVTIDCIAVKTPLIPLKKNHMRITDAKQRWILEPVGHERTRVTFISLTTIDGPAPWILKRLISNIIPATSLENFKSVSMKYATTSSSKYMARSESADKSKPTSGL